MTTSISLSAMATGQHALADRHANINGRTIHYKIGGQGPALLMLHGFTLTGEQWLPYAEKLTADYTVIVADLPFHGGSSPLDGTFSFKETAHLMEGLLEHLEITRIKGIGHSAGAIVLLYMATQKPELLESMVLVTGGHRLSERGRQLLVNEYFEDLDDELKAYYRSIHPGGDPQIKKIFDLENEMAADFAATITKGDLTWPVLHDIDVPALLVWGDRDKYFPVEVALELYLALPNSRLWVVPGQGHVPLWPEWGGDERVAELFVPAVKQFFEVPQPEHVDRLAPDYAEN